MSALTNNIYPKMAALLHDIGLRNIAGYKQEGEFSGTEFVGQRMAYRSASG